MTAVLYAGLDRNDYRQGGDWRTVAQQAYDAAKDALFDDNYAYTLIGAGGMRIKFQIYCAVYGLASAIPVDDLIYPEHNNVKEVMIQIGVPAEIIDFVENRFSPELWNRCRQHFLL